MGNVCATSSENRDYIHTIQYDFPASWYRMFDSRSPCTMESLAGVRRLWVEIYGPLSGAVQFPPTLRALVLIWNCNAEAGVLEDLDLPRMCPDLRELTLETSSLEWDSVTEVHARLLPDNLQVLWVCSCSSLWSIGSLPANLRELRVSTSFSLDRLSRF